MRHWHRRDRVAVKSRFKFKGVTVAPERLGGADPGPPAGASLRAEQLASDSELQASEVQLEVLLPPGRLARTSANRGAIISDYIF